MYMYVHGYLMHHLEQAVGCSVQANKLAEHDPGRERVLPWGFPSSNVQP